jgi:Glyoxalase/Bleomycin resistance protein/Dioxygenase superfamily
MKSAMKSAQKAAALVPMVHVESVARSIEFYALLGFEVGNTFTPKDQGAPSWAWLRAGRAHLMVTRASHPVDPAQQAVLFYLYVEDVAAFRAELQKAGVEVDAIQYPFYAPKGEFRLSDPDGYALFVTHTGS